MKRARCQGNTRFSGKDDGNHNLLVATVCWKLFLKYLNKNESLHFSELRPRETVYKTFSESGLLLSE